MRRISYDSVISSLVLIGFAAASGLTLWSATRVNSGRIETQMQQAFNVTYLSPDSGASEVGEMRQAFMQGSVPENPRYTDPNRLSQIAENGAQKRKDLRQEMLNRYFLRAHPR